jgi:hypothetical protein
MFAHKHAESDHIDLDQLHHATKNMLVTSYRLKMTEGSVLLPANSTVSFILTSEGSCPGQYASRNAHHNMNFEFASKKTPTNNPEETENKNLAIGASADSKNNNDTLYVDEHLCLRVPGLSPQCALPLSFRDMLKP